MSEQLETERFWHRRLKGEALRPSALERFSTIEILDWEGARSQMPVITSFFCNGGFFYLFGVTERASDFESPKMSSMMKIK